MEVYVYDPFVENKLITSKHCLAIDMFEGFRIADYISVHLPLNKNTKNLISKNEFELFKKNLILINTARGGIINEDALYEALINKSIHAAGLDVFETEPPKENNKLFSLNNIILTPHNSALTLECRKRMSIEAASSIVNYLTKREKLNLTNIVNKENLDI